MSPKPNKVRNKVRATQAAFQVLTDCVKIQIAKFKDQIAKQWLSPQDDQIISLLKGYIQKMGYIYSCNH